MANAYVNYKAIITTSELTTLYTVGSETTAIIKSLRITNVDEENDCKIRAFVVDTDSVSYTLETNRNVQKGTSEELFNSYSFSTSPVVLKESEVLKLQAENGGDLHAILSGARLSYSFTPRMFLQSLIQYNNVSNLLSVNARFGLLKNANTGLFVVLNILKDDDLLDYINNQRLTVKYTHTFDFIK